MKKILINFYISQNMYSKKLFKSMLGLQEPHEVLCERVDLLFNQHFGTSDLDVNVKMADANQENLSPSASNGSPRNSPSLRPASGLDQSRLKLHTIGSQLNPSSTPEIDLSAQKSKVTLPPIGNSRGAPSRNLNLEKQGSSNVFDRGAHSSF